MAKTHLTEAAVERYRRPAQGRTEVSDSEPGLFLWVTATGTKSWMVIYRLPSATGERSVRRKLAIGRHPAVGVAEARRQARETMELAAQGIDPEARAAAVREAEKRADDDRRAGSFRAVVEEYVAAMKAGKLTGGRKRPVVSSTVTDRKSLLDRHVLLDLGDRPLSEITPKMVAGLLSRIEKASGPVDNTLKVIRGVYNFAQSRGLHHGPLPTGGMTKRQAPVIETRALSDDELRAVWNAAKGSPGSFGLALRLLMLTGQRRSEIAGLRWEEVDWDRKLLVIPADRVKNRAGAHEVALTEPALAILRDALAAYEARALTSGLVFPSDTGDTPIGGWTQLRKKLTTTVRGELAGLDEADWRVVRANGALRADTQQRKANALGRIKAVSTTPWRIHDLRHTFITRCRDGEENAAGEITWSAPLDVLQATVNHEITAGVTARYDHGDLQRRYRLRKRELMEWWGRKLLTIVEEAKKGVVIQMPQARAR